MGANELVLLNQNLQYPTPYFLFPSSCAATALLCAAANSLRQLTAAKRMMAEDAALVGTNGAGQDLDGMDWDAGGIIEEDSAETRVVWICV